MFGSVSPVSDGVRQKILVQSASKLAGLAEKHNGDNFQNIFLYLKPKCAFFFHFGQDSSSVLWVVSRAAERSVRL